MIHTKKAALAAALAAVATLALAGCSAPATASSSSTSAASVVPLVLYSAQGYDSVMAKAFQKSTGIPVKLVDDSTGPLLTKVEAEKNNPQWGLLWVDGDTAFASLDKRGMLEPYLTTNTLNTVGKALTPKDHSYTPTGATVMAALIYNSAKVTSVPTSYSDLLGSPYAGKVGMNDPSQSGPTYPFIAGVMNQLGGQSGGVKAGETYFTKLKANGLKVYPTNGDTLHALETGQIQYGLIQSSAAEGEVLKLAAKPVAGFAPKVAYLPKATLLPGVIAIDKGASDAVKAEAKKFIDFTLSAAGQKVMQTGDPQGDSLYWPVVDSVQPLAGLSPLPSAYQTIDPYFWGPLQGEVVTWFTSSIK